MDLWIWGTWELGELGETINCCRDVHAATVIQAFEAKCGLSVKPHAYLTSTMRLCMERPLHP